MAQDPFALFRSGSPIPSDHAQDRKIRDREHQCISCFGECRQIAARIRNRVGRKAIRQTASGPSIYRARKHHQRTHSCLPLPPAREQWARYRIAKRHHRERFREFPALLQSTAPARLHCKGIRRAFSRHAHPDSLHDRP